MDGYDNDDDNDDDVVVVVVVKSCGKYCGFTVD